MKHTKVFILVLLTFLYVGKVSSQVDTIEESLNFYLKTGELIIGEIVEIKENRYIVDSHSLGVVDIFYYELLRVDKFEGFTHRFLDLNSFHSSRYNILDLAIMPQKGTLSYTNTWIFGNTINYSLTSRLKASSDFQLVWLFGDAEYHQEFSLGLQYNLIKKHDSALSISAKYIYQNKNEKSYMGYLTYTVGDLHNNLSIGAGYGRKKNIEPERFFILPVFAGCHFKITKRTSFVSEVIYMGNFNQNRRWSRKLNFWLYSVGGRRYFKENRGSLNLGVFKTNTEDYFLPYLSITLPLRNKQQSVVDIDDDY